MTQTLREQALALNAQLEASERQAMAAAADYLAGEAAAAFLAKLVELQGACQVNSPFDRQLTSVQRAIASLRQFAAASVMRPAAAAVDPAAST